MAAPMMKEKSVCKQMMVATDVLGNGNRSRLPKIGRMPKGNNISRRKDA